MSSKFLASSTANLGDGSTAIYASTLAANNLDSGTAVKVNSQKQLYSSNLEIADVSGLQAAIDGKISNPASADLDMATFSINDVKIISGDSSLLMKSSVADDTNNIEVNNLETVFNKQLNMNSNPVINISDTTTLTSASLGNGATNGGALIFSGTNTGENKITVPTDKADALIIRDSLGGMMALQTTTGNRKFKILAPVDMDNFQIKAVAAPTDGGDAATKNYADTKLPLLGGTISGDLKVNGFIDSDDLGTLAIAPSDATKLELGAAGITTEVKGVSQLTGGIQQGLVVQETMTSDVLPVPHVSSASSIFSAGFEAYRAFDKNVSTQYISIEFSYTSATGVYAGGATTTIQDVSDVKGEWLQMDFGQSKTMNSYRMHPRSGLLNRMPSEWYLVYSDDGSTWHQADYRIGITFTSGYQTFSLPSEKTGRYFRMITVVIGTSGTNRTSWDMGELEYTFRDDLSITASSIDINGALKVNGFIDTSDAGTLQIAPSDATKLELGAIDITTEVKGDFNVGDYVEPNFVSNLTYMNSTITKVGRTITGASSAQRRWALSEDTFTPGTTTENYKMILKYIGASGKWSSVGLAQIDPVNVTDFGLTATNVSLALNTLPSIPLLAAAGSTVITSNLIVVNTNDILEFRLTNTCRNVDIYHHGSSINNTPTLMVEVIDIPVGNAWRWIIGDNDTETSQFVIELVSKTNAFITGDLTVGGLIDIKNAGPLQIAPSDATKLELGAIDITTEVKGPSQLTGGIQQEIVVQETMTSDVSPAPYVALASSTFLEDPFKAFDKKIDTFWHGGLTQFTDATGVYAGAATTSIQDVGDVKGEWIQLDLGEVKRLSFYRMHQRDALVERMPSTWYLVYSDDGSTWRQADLRTGIVFAGAYHSFTLPSETSGRYFRMVITVIGTTGTGRTTVNLGELEYNFRDDLSITAKEVSINGDLKVSGTLTGDADIGSGFVFFDGDDYTTPVEFKDTPTTTKLTCNGVTQTVTSQIPKSGHLFWDTATSTIVPEFEGDAYTLELRIRAENNAAQGGYFGLEIDIGGGILIPLGTITFPKGQDVIHDFSKTTSIFCLNTFKANGGIINLIAPLNSGVTTVSKFGVLISRIHRAR